MASDLPAIFHLSFPVACLEASVAFYRECLGARIGRSSDAWTDVILFGHQVTLHNKPDQVLARDARGVRHFGAILSWEDWETVRSRVLAYGPSSKARVRHYSAGEPGEHIKLLLEDPDGNLIEVKAYKSPEEAALPEVLRKSRRAA